MIHILIDRVPLTETIIIEGLKKFKANFASRGEWKKTLDSNIEGIKSRKGNINRMLHNRIFYIKPSNIAFIGKYEVRVVDDEVLVFLHILDRHYLLPENDDLLLKIREYNPIVSEFNAVDDTKFPFKFVRRVLVTKTSPCEIVSYDVIVVHS